MNSDHVHCPFLDRDIRNEIKPIGMQILSPPELNDFNIKERVHLATSLSCQTTNPVMNIDYPCIC